jgi:uncharacterized protein
MPAGVQPITIAVDDKQVVSGLLQVPPGVRVCYVLAHGAGAGMQHPFLEKVANGLFDRRIATLRYQFPYMERGAKQPDKPAIAQATARAAVEIAARLVPGLPLVAGGKSFGGRMTSQAQAESPLPGVRGLLFLGFPLHAAGKSSDERAKHLFHVQIPMLFLQGTRDALADFSLMQSLTKRLGTRASLEIVQDADHSFRVPARSRRTEALVTAGMLAAIERWAHQFG